MHTLFQGTQYKKIIDLLKKELSGKARWNLNDPELDRHIRLFSFFFFAFVMQNKNDYFKINAKFWTTVPKFFDFLSLDKRGSSYRR